MSTKLSLNSAKLGGVKKKIESPLAKYNSTGQLFCVLCNTQVKNEMYWTGHVNGKSHREAFAALKTSKGVGSTSGGSGAVKRTTTESSGSTEAKKSRTEGAAAAAPGMMGPPKSIMSSSSNSKNKPTSNLMTLKALEDEEDDRMEVESTSSISSTKSDLSRIEEALKDSSEDRNSTATSSASVPEDEPPAAASLPAGFFDDAKEDAKARGIDYRNPEEAEWERFMKEIASEEVKSSVLRTVDEEESAKDRELDEIEEQMKNWQRVIELEKKAQQVRQQLEQEKSRKMSSKSAADSDSEDDVDFDEDLDWRSKKY